MHAQQILVRRTRRWSKVRNGRPPLVDEGVEASRTEARIEPLASCVVGLGSCEPTRRVALRRERTRRALQAPGVVAVPSLPPSRRELAHRTEAPPPTTFAHAVLRLGRGSGAATLASRCDALAEFVATRDSSSHAAISAGSKRSRCPHLRNGMRRSATRRRTWRTLTPRCAASVSMSTRFGSGVGGAGRSFMPECANRAARSEPVS
jgi:hypothetical protein